MAIRPLRKKIVETKTNTNQKENMVGMAVYPIQDVAALGVLPNLYEVLRYLVGSLHLFC